MSNSLRLGGAFEIFTNPDGTLYILFDDEEWVNVSLEKEKELLAFLLKRETEALKKQKRGFDARRKTV
jgi:hypothetical protein